VLKFFFDQPKTDAGDTALAEAVGQLPVALQARLIAGGDTSPIPERFRFTPRLATAVGANAGWIPLPSLMQHAAAIGFVDFNGAAIPLFETYRGATYKSLVVCCLELAEAAPAQAGINRIWFGSHFLPVDSKHVFYADLSQPEAVKVISFLDLISGKAAEEDIRQRVVIIGWDGTRSPTVPTPQGEMKIHRFFVQCLAATYRALMAKHAP
jgi:CHASE2 domain-containing sensor protein